MYDLFCDKFFSYLRVKHIVGSGGSSFWFFLLLLYNIPLHAFYPSPVSSFILSHTAVSILYVSMYKGKSFSCIPREALARSLGDL